MARPASIAHADARRVRQILTEPRRQRDQVHEAGAGHRHSSGKKGAARVVRVSDTGPGISPAERAMIFEEYKQAGEERAEAARDGPRPGDRAPARAHARRHDPRRERGRARLDVPRPAAAVVRIADEELRPACAARARRNPMKTVAAMLRREADLVQVGRRHLRPGPRRALRLAALAPRLERRMGRDPRRDRRWRHDVRRGVRLHALVTSPLRAARHRGLSRRRRRRPRRGSRRSSTHSPRSSRPDRTPSRRSSSALRRSCQPLPPGHERPRDAGVAGPPRRHVRQRRGPPAVHHDALAGRDGPRGRAAGDDRAAPV